jgi:hypothetical protein
MEDTLEGLRQRMLKDGRTAAASRRAYELATNPERLREREREASRKKGEKRKARGWIRKPRTLEQQARSNAKRKAARALRGAVAEVDWEV